MGSCYRSIFNDRKDDVEWSNQKKEVAMKFLMIVLALRFIGEMIGIKRKARQDNTVETTGVIFHPAEYNLR